MIGYAKQETQGQCYSVPPMPVDCEREPETASALSALSAATERLDYLVPRLETKLSLVLSTPAPGVTDTPKDQGRFSSQLPNIIESYREKISRLSDHLENIIERIEV